MASVVTSTRVASRRRSRDRRRVVVSVVVFAYVLALAVNARAQEDNCVASGQTAIFVQFSENAGTAVFQSDDNACLAGGGRGVGCCPGSICDVVKCRLPCKDGSGESVDCAVDGATEDANAGFYQCPCEPCPTGTVQGLSSKHACVECPAGWYNSEKGQATCTPCPVGTFSSRVANPTGCAPRADRTSGQSTLEGVLRQDDAHASSADERARIGVRRDDRCDVVHGLSRGYVRRRCGRGVRAVRARDVFRKARRDVHAVSRRHVRRRIRWIIHRRVHSVRRG